MLFKYFIQEQQVAIRRRLKRYLKSLNLSVKKLICNEVVRCQPASLRRKLFHTSSFMYFTFIFSGCITITSSKEGLKVCEYNFFQRKVLLLVIYLFNHDSSKSVILHVEYVFSRFFVSCNIKLILCVLICTFFIKS